MGGSLQHLDFYTYNHEPLAFLLSSSKDKGLQIPDGNQYSPSYPDILRPAFNRNIRNFGNDLLLMVKKEKGKESFSTRSLPSKKVKNMNLLIMGER